MSATRDTSQKATFVYSNLYKLYKQAKAAPQSGAVLKTHDLKSMDPVAIQPFRPTELLKTRLEQEAKVPHSEELARVRPIPAAVKRVLSPTERTSAVAVDSLKKNLSELNELHERLKFMLKEIEELTKK